MGALYFPPLVHVSSSGFAVRTRTRTLAHTRTHDCVVSQDQIGFAHWIVWFVLWIGFAFAGSLAWDSAPSTISGFDRVCAPPRTTARFARLVHADRTFVLRSTGSRIGIPRRTFYPYALFYE